MKTFESLRSHPWNTMEARLSHLKPRSYSSQITNLDFEDPNPFVKDNITPQYLSNEKHPFDLDENN